MLNMTKVITKNSSNVCVLDVDLKCPKEFQELHIDYPFALDKVEIKKTMLSKDQLITADFYFIPTSCVDDVGIL